MELLSVDGCMKLIIRFLGPRLGKHGMLSNMLSTVGYRGYLDKAPRSALLVSCIRRQARVPSKSVDERQTFRKLRTELSFCIYIFFFCRQTLLKNYDLNLSDSEISS